MIRQIMHAAEAVVLGAATVAVITTCVMDALRPKVRPPRNEPEKPGRAGTADPMSGEAGRPAAAAIGPGPKAR
jgi:hypothetical protein